MLRTYYQIQKLDKNKKIISKTRKYKSRSFVRQFLEVFFGHTSNVSTTYFNTSNGQVSVDNDCSNKFLTTSYGGDGWAFEEYDHTGSSHQLTATREADAYGIIIGTSTQAVAVTDYALITPIAHGTGSGEMHYFSTNVEGINIDNGSGIGTFNIERIFFNESGSGITVNEIGIYQMNGTQIFCAIRDVLASPVTVGDDEYLKVVYTLKINV